MPKRDEGALAQRATYKAFHMVSTRWADNDQYGHINNAKGPLLIESETNWEPYILSLGASKQDT